MDTLIVYESMYGNTHHVADRIADGLRPFGSVTVVPVGEASAELVGAADLVVVGGPTHIHGLTSARTRAAAADAASKEGTDLTLDESAQGPGLREWFDSLADGGGKPAAAFDTRMPGPPIFTGRASQGISQRLRRRHFKLAVSPQSFLVGKDNHMLEGVEAVATAWGTALGQSVEGVGDGHHGAGMPT